MHNVLGAENSAVGQIGRFFEKKLFRVRGGTKGA